MPGLSPSGREDRHYLHVSALAFRADEFEQSGNVNEYRFFRQLQLIERQLRTMTTAIALAMDRKPGFACRSGLTDCLSWLASRHVAGLAQRG